MAPQAGKLTFENGRNRLFEPINQFIILNAAICLSALWAAKALGTGIAHDDTSVDDSFLFPLSLEIPLGGVLETTFSEKPPPTWTLTLSNGRKASERTGSDGFTQGFNSIAWLPITPCFVDFFEKHQSWVKQSFGEQKNWPPTFYFARAIRNAIAHGGKLHFLHDPRRTAIWHNVQYDFSHHGTQIIGTRGAFSAADLVLLMIDTSDELDAVGCRL